jgi:hypothetical protein
MQMALEWFEWCLDDKPASTISARGIAASLREVLAQPQDHSEQHLNMVKGEPVAWMDAEGDVYKMPVVDKWLPPHQMLYTTPPSVEAAIEETKEKAAKVCDEQFFDWDKQALLVAKQCAAAIRSMK